MFGKYRTLRILNGGNKQTKGRRLRIVRAWTPSRSADGRVLTVPFGALQIGPKQWA